jgi:hypothetical protein
MTAAVRHIYTKGASIGGRYVLSYPSIAPLEPMTPDDGVRCP